MRAKDERRVHVGPHLTFLFENHETIRYQVQEMMRSRADGEGSGHPPRDRRPTTSCSGGPGEVGCTLLVEIDDPAVRAEKLAQWLALPKHLYVKRSDGKKAYARYDERQVGETRVSVRPVPEVRDGDEGAGRGRLRPPGPGAAPRDGAHRGAARGPAAGPGRVAYNPGRWSARAAAPRWRRTPSTRGWAARSRSTCAWSASSSGSTAGRACSSRRRRP